MAKDVIVNDEYLSECSKYFEDSTDSIETIISNYNTILKHLIDSGITNGETNKTLTKYYENSSRLNGKFSQVGSNAKSEIDGYLENIEDLDQKIY
ncbi:MAG: hypothetical protein MR398_07415 [Oscillospiraceae bacterium]|nr:hypothetical protein [Oscillospiraceae bacterium]